MFHVLALIVAAVMYLVYGIYRFRKPAQRRSWKLASYILGGAVLAWYEVQMFWYWLVLGAVLIVLAMFDKSASQKKTVKH